MSKTATTTPEEVQPANLHREEDRILMERALATQASLLAAPELLAEEDVSDEYKDKARLYVPEAFNSYRGTGAKRTIARKATRHAYYADPNKLEAAVAKGYVPVHDRGEFVRGPGGEILTTCDIKLHEIRERRIQEESERRLNRKGGKSKRGRAPEGIRFARKPAPGEAEMESALQKDIRVEEFSRERRTTEEGES